MDDLRKLAEDKNIRDARKLYQYAQSKGYSVSVKDAAEALKHSVQRQVLSNGPRYKGHFASVGPGKDLQLDLIDRGANNLKAKRGVANMPLLGQMCSPANWLLSHSKPRRPPPCCRPKTTLLSVWSHTQKTMIL